MEYNNIFEELVDRGYFEQATYEEELKELLSKERVKFYVGFDATADSLTIGHFIQIMVMKRMQNYGHIPIALLGGGTTMIGDPSGRSDMRMVMTEEQINYNAQRFFEQLSRFIDFSDGKAILANNADWLRNLNYIEFLRDVGEHFSVNRMLAAECYKSRMENGLSFLEFNYMIMQAYDFYVLNHKYNCTMQLGGDDQWSNMIAGVELLRRKDRKSAYAMTCTLLTNSEGKKMGKTAKGALWLDPKKTTPYEFYQYWRNIDDQDVEKCLALLTFLPMDEVRRLGALKDAEINETKKVLAYEVTKIIHGEEEATKAKEATEALFGSGNNLDNAPKIEVTDEDFSKELLDVLVDRKIIKTKSEGRRLIEQNGMSLNDEKIKDVKFTLNNTLGLLKLGKKKFYNIVKK